MSLESEFADTFVTFHHNIDKALTLLELYPNAQERRAFASFEKAVPNTKDCFIALLKDKDPRILKVFRWWRSPEKTADLAEEIFKKEIGGHLAADLTYTFWKYADVVRILRVWQRKFSKKVVLEQSIVAACTAYESFLREMIPWVLKNNKESARRFLGRVGKVSVMELGKYDFDPMTNAHRIFAEEYENPLFPVFPKVVEFFRDVIPIKMFSGKREERYVEKIFQVRHCIVHNAGKPDERWNAKTGGAKFRIDLRNSSNYVGRIDFKLHETAYALLDYLGLDREEAFRIISQSPGAHSNVS